MASEPNGAGHTLKPPPLMMASYAGRYSHLLQVLLDRDLPQGNQMQSDEPSRQGHLEMNQELLATVIVPVRNGSRTLARCLEAIMASEDIPSLEVIVVDDGSSDSSPQIAASFPVRLIDCRKGSGPAAARNLGAEAATTPRLVFIDADVFVKPDTIKRLLATLDEAPACFGSYDPEPLHHNFATVFYHVLSCRSIADTSTRTSVFYSYAAAIWRRAFLDLGGFDTLFTQATFEDVDLGCKLAERGLHVVHLKDAVVIHAVQYNVPRLVRAYSRKSRDLAALLLARRAMSVSDQGWTHRKNWVVLLTAWATLGLALPAIWAGSSWRFAWAVAALAFLALSLGIVRSIGRKNPVFAFLAVPFYLVVNVVATAGMVAALGMRRLGTGWGVDSGFVPSARKYFHEPDGWRGELLAGVHPATCTSKP